jgi:hypothetical protein
VGKDGARTLGGREAAAPGERAGREHVIFYLPDAGGPVVVQRIVHGADWRGAGLVGG